MEKEECSEREDKLEKEEYIEEEALLEKEVMRSLKAKKSRKIISLTAIIIIALIFLAIFFVYPYLSGLIVVDYGKNETENATGLENLNMANETEEGPEEDTSEETAENNLVDNEAESEGSSGDSGDSGGDGGDSGGEEVLHCDSNNNCTYLNSICAYGICNSSNECEIAYNSSSTICRESLGECDIAEYCNGSFAGCPSNEFQIEGAECSSGTCSQGECVGLNIDSCRILNQENRKYVLNASIINNSLISPCIEIVAENITLDCQGNSITSGSSATGAHSNSTLTTIKNCNTNMGNDAGGYGVYLENSNGSYIFNNTLSSQHTGLFLSSASNCLIENNIINFNANKGIHLLFSYNTTLQNNQIENTSFYGLGVYKSAGNLIQDNKFLGNIEYGIFIEKSLTEELDGANQIINNIVSSSRENIYVKTSDNIIKGNIINNSQLYNGLYIYDASNNTIENNILRNNKMSGLGLNYANNSIIVNNTISSNENYGIELYSSNSNTIENNTAFLNLVNGLHVEASSDNSILNNVFCNNTEDVYCSENQIFENNLCGSGSICGGSCETCEEFGDGITGAVVGAEKGIKDDLFVIIFVVITVILVVLVNLRNTRKK